jgi:hypothetical protein
VTLNALWHDGDSRHFIITRNVAVSCPSLVAPYPVLTAIYAPKKCSILAFFPHSQFSVSKIVSELPLACFTYPVPERSAELCLPKLRERRQPFAVQSGPMCRQPRLLASPRRMRHTCQQMRSTPIPRPHHMMLARHCTSLA